MPTGQCLGYRRIVSYLAYEERVSSTRTEVLFAVLGLSFLLLFAWRVTAVGFKPSTVIFLCLFGFFLFYSLNYRRLIVRITPESVELTFGIFNCSVPLHTIDACLPDETPMWRIGGAGIHFLIIRKRYRAMFNFLEHERVVLSLSRRRGLVREIAFSTKHPDEVARLISAAISQNVRTELDPEF